MIKTQKTRIAALLLVLITLFTALFIPINAAEPETSKDKGIEEIMPIAAYSCYVSGKPYVPVGANLIREDEGPNKSAAFAAYVKRLGYEKGEWRYKMETYGFGAYDIYECHYWYNNAYPQVYFHHL